MDILKRIDQALSFCTIYSDNACSTEVDKWRHHVTPHLLNDVRQYIESLQLKLMHCQSAQENPMVLESLIEMTKHFTKTPSSLKDSEIRGRAHKAIASANSPIDI